MEHIQPHNTVEHIQPHPTVLGMQKLKQMWGPWPRGAVCQSCHGREILISESQECYVT